TGHVRVGSGIVGPARELLLAVGHLPVSQELAAGSTRPRVLADPPEGAHALHWFRRLRIRWEIREDIHHAFVTLGCAVICWRRLRTALC
ncbi:hypothetical protein ACIO1D_43490, partial [Streptomyces antimycoticus]